MVLLLLTRKENRTSTVFVLNVLALAFNIMRLLCQILHYTTNFEEIYPYFTYDYSSVDRGSYAISIIAVTTETLLIVCIEISLVLQVGVVFSTTKRIYRNALLSVVTVVALVPIGFRLAYMIASINEIITLRPWTAYLTWLQYAALLTITISICLFSAIFVAKLGYAMKHQKRLGIRDFGPVKVIFIFGCQTLIIPAVITILQFHIDVPEFGSNALTLVTIDLPLSSLWAGVMLEGNNSESDDRFRTLWQKFTFSRRDIRAAPVEIRLNPPTAETVCYSPKANSVTFSDPGSPLGGISVRRNVSVRSDHQPENWV